MGGRTGGLVGGLAVVVGVCHYTIASSILVTTIVKLNFFIIKCQFQAFRNVAKTDTSIATTERLGLSGFPKKM